MSLFEDRYKDNIPLFITNKVDQEIDEYIIKNKVTSLSTKVKDCCIGLLKNYIYENFLLILFVVGIIIFLTYRYYMKKQKEPFRNNDYNNDDIDDTFDLLQFQNKKFVRPTMNPIYPINKQQNYALYPNNKMPFKADGVNVSYVRDFTNDDQKVVSGRDLRDVGVPAQNFTNIYPNYGYNQSVGQCYSGLSNPYSKPPNTPEFRNALGHPTDFNNTTGNFITNSVKHNQNVMQIYHDILQNRNNILNNLNVE